MARHRPSKYLPNADGNPNDHESRVACRLGGKRVRGSGSSMYSKGDVRDVGASCGDDSVGFLVECKQTIHASLSVKWSWLTKINREANAVQKEPALAIEIQGGKDDLLCDRDWIMIPARTMERLLRTQVRDEG